MKLQHFAEDTNSQCHFNLAFQDKVLSRFMLQEFQFSASVYILKTVFCDVVQSSVVKVYQRFEVVTYSIIRAISDVREKNSCSHRESY